MSEYTERNLCVANAEGLHNGLCKTLDRMAARRDCPRWLIGRPTPKLSRTVARSAEGTQGDSLARRLQRPVVRSKERSNVKYIAVITEWWVGNGRSEVMTLNAETEEQAKQEAESECYRRSGTFNDCCYALIAIGNNETIANRKLTMRERLTGRMSYNAVGQVR